MRDDSTPLHKQDGRFKPGERRSPATEFKPGQHWRPRKPYWDSDWLRAEYVDKQRSAAEIASDWGINEEAILFWLRKHDIPRRSIAGARAVKHWVLAGEKNGMFGKRGADVPNWKGGVTADRQAFYSSLEWKQVSRLIWQRDRATCQRCGTPAKVRGRFHIHHIVSFAVRELRADPENLVLLCGPCHRWVHSKANTDLAFIGKEV